MVVVVAAVLYRQRGQPSIPSVSGIPIQAAPAQVIVRVQLTVPMPRCRCMQFIQAVPQQLRLLYLHLRRMVMTSWGGQPVARLPPVQPAVTLPQEM